MTGERKIMTFLSVTAGEESIKVKLSSDVETLLKSV
jgi:hypothetical protein